MLLYHVVLTLLSSMLLFLSTVSVTAHYHSADERCTMDEHSPPPEVKARMAQEAKEFETKEKMKRNSFRWCKQCITIDTYMWVFQPDATFVRPDEDVPLYKVDATNIQEQFNVLVDGFKESPFTFRLVEFQIIENNKYYSRFDDLEKEIGSTFRKGNWDTLNLYYGAADAGSFAFFPPLSSLDDNGSVNPIDGAWNDISTMPGVDPNEDSCCRMGITTIHEVGHWLGLYHTFERQAGFEEEGCNPNDPNDFVDDTPQQRNNTDFICPDDNTDTCPDLPGFDPIHNYMDYSSDDCYTEFTRGQMDRMYAVWSLYRTNAEACGTFSSKFELQIDTDPVADATNWQLEATDGSFLVNQRMGGFEHTVKGDVTYYHDICLANGKEFKFTIFDSQGDGLPEGYTYILSLNDVVIKDGAASFGSSETHVFNTQGQMAPTSSPTVFVPPTFVTFVIKFDAFPEEVSYWIIDDVTQEILAIKETFDDEFIAQMFSKTFFVEKGQSYTLHIRDSFGDGLQGGEGSPDVGYYALYYGNEIDETMLLLRQDNFNDEEDQVTFVASDPTGTVQTSSPTTASPTSTAPSSSPPTNMAPSSPQATQCPEGTFFLPGIGCLCFSGDSMVEVEDVGMVELNNLKIGDVVKVDTDKYEPVFSFGHYLPVQTGTFMQIATESGNIITISADHMIEQPGGVFAPANMVKIGGSLMVNGAESKVVSVKQIQSKGLYAPFTPSGKIVVDGISASCYVAFDRDSTTMPITIFGGYYHYNVSFQWLAHSFEFPHRLACHYMGTNKCASEKYSTEGVSTWVEIPLRISKFVLALESNVIKSALFGTAVIVLSGFNLVEMFFFQYLQGLLSLLLLCVATIAVNRRKKNKIETYR